MDQNGIKYFPLGRHNILQFGFKIKGILYTLQFHPVILRHWHLYWLLQTLCHQQKKVHLTYCNVILDKCFSQSIEAMENESKPSLKWAPFCIFCKSLSVCYVCTCICSLTSEKSNSLNPFVPELFYPVLKHFNL